MTTPLQLIVNARARIERGWTQHAVARNAEGERVNAADPSATCWCLQGALWAEDPTRIPKGTHDTYWKALVTAYFELAASIHAFETKDPLSILSPGLRPPLSNPTPFPDRDRGNRLIPEDANSCTLGVWNDEYATSRDLVLQVMDTAIARLS